MNISLLSILRTVSWDFRRDMAQNYANMLKNAIELHIDNDVEKCEGFFLSKKGTQKLRGNFEDKLYVGNIHRIEDHLYWDNEQLADDDQIINVVVINGPVTRDGGACSYGTKDWRNQVMYANTIPQVVGHIFIINTPGGESLCRNDYEIMINDCREKGKPTVAFVDGMCCSSGVNLSSRCDRTIVMNPKDEVGCIGSMAAFWATPDGTVDRDGTRYVEIVGNEVPDKNGWYREAAKGNYEELQELVNKDTNEFHQSVRENRPLVTDDMLTGKVFPAQALIPALVDEVGNLDRAIECVFQLADGTLPAARTVVKGNEEPEQEEPEQSDNPDPVPEADPEPEAPEGPEDVPEISNQQNDNNMTDEEKKAQEATEAQAAQEQAPETEQSAEDEQKPVDEKPTADATELAKMQDALKSAEGIIADRDKSIAGKDAIIADRDKAIKEKDETIAKLKQQVSDLKTEVKELAAKPEPMNDGDGGVPKDNGTGEAPQQKKYITRGMTYEEVRAAKKQEAEDRAAAKAAKRAKK